MARVRVGMSFDDMTARILRGEMQLHKFPRGFLVTEVKNFHEERVLMVQLLSGECLEEWAPEALARLRECARANNCVAIEALCRRGLEPILKPLGFKKTRVLLRVQT